MGKLDRGSSTGNVNVTLDRQSQGGPFAGKTFPCCICSARLDIPLSKRGKPYCTCVPCGIQIFFRGKTGIRRLMDILDSGNLTQGTACDTAPAIILYNRILQLRSQKKDLENAIHVIDNEIKCVQGELEKLSRKHRVEKIK
jgi:hypothetical protein